MRRLTGLVEQFSSLKIAPEQKQWDSGQLCHRQPLSICQTMPSLHDGHYTTGEQRLALKPARAPYPDCKMQFPLLYPRDEETCPAFYELHINSRIYLSVSRQHLRQCCLDELRRRPDAEHSGLPTGKSLRALPQSFGIRQEPSGPLQEFGAVPCEDDAAPDAVE